MQAGAELGVTSRFSRATLPHSTLTLRRRVRPNDPLAGENGYRTGKPGTVSTLALLPALWSLPTFSPIFILTQSPRPDYEMTPFRVQRSRTVHCDGAGLLAVFGSKADRTTMARRRLRPTPFRTVPRPCSFAVSPGELDLALALALALASAR